MFLYIVPLKQGLKLCIQKEKRVSSLWFLYIVPLKQGLKLIKSSRERKVLSVFIHSSIKTRIETDTCSGRYVEGWKGFYT